MTDAEERAWFEKLPPAAQREWLDYKRRARVHTAAEELGHALVARLDGWPITFLTIIPARGYLGITLTGDAPSDLDHALVYGSWSTHAQAGDLAGRLMGVTPELLELASLEIDEAAATEAAIARLGPEDAARVREVIAREESGDSDAQKIERTSQKAAKPGMADEFERITRFRAWGSVAKIYPLLLALMPPILRERAWTGNDLEEAITATGKDT